MIDLLNYAFIVRGLEAGLIIAIIAPVIGIFMVLKRYSLIADTLSHVSLAGIAIGLLLNINPLLTAIITTVISSAAIEKLRFSKKIYGESALALFLSGSLAVAVVLIGLSHSFNTNLFNYLFGSISTVTSADILTVGSLGLIILLIMILLFKEFVYVTFDEDSARVSGLPVNYLNYLFIIISAVTISLAIPIVGILLISSLLVVPVITALQFKKSFISTIIIAQSISCFSVISGIVGSFYLNIAPGGAIVLITLSIFILTQLINRK